MAGPERGGYRFRVTPQRGSFINLNTPIGRNSKNREQRPPVGGLSAALMLLLKGQNELVRFRRYVRKTTAAAKSRRTAVRRSCSTSGCEPRLIDVLVECPGVRICENSFTRRWLLSFWSLSQGRFTTGRQERNVCKCSTATASSCGSSRKSPTIRMQLNPGDNANIAIR